ncbi:MAG: DNRLRE domain-containing protein [Gammaproteobacteria bacterium]
MRFPSLLKPALLSSVLAIGLLASHAQAAIVSLDAVTDLGLLSDDQAINHESGTSFSVLEQDGSGHKTDRGLISWSLPGDFSGKTVNSATLKLYVRYANLPTHYAPNAQIGVALMDQAWTTAANWNTRDGTNSWTQAGAGHVLSNPGNVVQTFASIGYVDENPSESRVIELDVTTLVQDWADGTANNGVMIYAANNSISTFFTSESGSAPLLTVDYSEASSVNSPAGLALLLTGVGMLSLYRRRANES